MNNFLCLTEAKIQKYILKTMTYCFKCFDFLQFQNRCTSPVADLKVLRHFFSFSDVQFEKCSSTGSCDPPPHNIPEIPESVTGKALADPGSAPSARPPKGPDSFVLTYKFYET